MTVFPPKLLNPNPAKQVKSTPLTTQQINRLCDVALKSCKEEYEMQEAYEADVRESDIHFDTADEYLELTQDIFFGYDGYTKSEDLMELIDEGREYIKRAREILKQEKRAPQKGWFITLMEKIEPTEYTFPETGSVYTPCFFTEKEDAIDILHVNATDIREGSYNYAVLEHIEEGLYNELCEEIWFKYDKDRNGYFEIEKPKCTKHVCHWAFSGRGKNK